MRPRSFTIFQLVGMNWSWVDSRFLRGSYTPWLSIYRTCFQASKRWLWLASIQWAFQTSWNNLRVLTSHGSIFQCDSNFDNWRINNDVSQNGNDFCVPGTCSRGHHILWWAVYLENWTTIAAKQLFNVQSWQKLPPLQKPLHECEPNKIFNTAWTISSPHLKVPRTMWRCTASIKLHFCLGKRQGTTR